MAWNNSDQLVIPIVCPVSVGNAKSSGRTQPLEMRCQSEQGMNDYIVKLWNSQELGLGVHCLAREVYGAVLAGYFNLLTPEIAFVDIDADFYVGQPDQIIRERLQQSPGLNFGSKYIHKTPIFSGYVPTTKISEAAKIFCFDMLIGNLDRNARKSNMLDSAKGYVLIDHEQAFPFSRPITVLGGYPDPWVFITEKWSRDHVFYPSLKGKNCEFDIEEFITILSGLSDDIFATIESQIPGSWFTPDLNLLRAYLAKTRDNAHLFKRSLQELLA